MALPVQEHPQVPRRCRLRPNRRDSNAIPCAHIEPNANAMTMTWPKSSSLSESSSAKANSPLKIWNLTRRVALAHRVEIADHGPTRRKGLLGRNSLPAGEGLWIIPCEAVHTFGMKFPIDLVYIDRKKRVKKIRSGVPPWRVSACLSAHSVVELASGTVEMTQTRPGDRLEFSPADLLVRAIDLAPAHPQRPTVD